MINRLIEKFGGINSMARALNIPPTTVQSWKNKNNIPNWRFPNIIITARKNNIDISEFDFLTANDFYGIEEKEVINNEQSS